MPPRKRAISATASTPETTSQEETPTRAAPPAAGRRRSRTTLNDEASQPEDAAEDAAPKRQRADTPAKPPVAKKAAETPEAETSAAAAEAPASRPGISRPGIGIRRPGAGSALSRSTAGTGPKTPLAAGKARGALSRGSTSAKAPAASSKAKAAIASKAKASAGSKSKAAAGGKAKPRKRGRSDEDDPSDDEHADDLSDLDDEEDEESESDEEEDDEDDEDHGLHGARRPAAGGSTSRPGAPSPVKHSVPDIRQSMATTVTAANMRQPNVSCSGLGPDAMELLSSAAFGIRHPKAVETASHPSLPFAATPSGMPFCLVDWVASPVPGTGGGDGGGGGANDRLPGADARGRCTGATSGYFAQHPAALARGAAPGADDGHGEAIDPVAGGPLLLADVLLLDAPRRTAKAMMALLVGTRPVQAAAWVMASIEAGQWLGFEWRHNASAIGHQLQPFTLDSWPDSTGKAVALGESRWARPQLPRVHDPPLLASQPALYLAEPRARADLGPLLTQAGCRVLDAPFGCDFQLILAKKAAANRAAATAGAAPSSSSSPPPPSPPRGAALVSDLPGVRIDWVFDSIIHGRELPIAEYLTSAAPDTKAAPAKAPAAKAAPAAGGGRGRGRAGAASPAASQQQDDHAPALPSAPPPHPLPGPEDRTVSFDEAPLFGAAAAAAGLSI
ncbi:hypothetical protein H696_05978 [Fonticula alba]|uniref:BRCT domain-containing protein n=1 Tax=Fonticula alba TaxID=691883 RepID=A0A058Z0D1_FONAL|nr:hypothetical protein H696_05978 [Fonticula alba]KCV67581.1 hypothetical protein H696_05978 [Fonticula alba]|eukprot:XP_009498022.1 hypothetical protein H696_05978 [Fonticula alba]